MSLQRQMERQARIKQGITENPHPKVLDAFNNRENMREAYLHPRKGYRTFSVKRSKAAMITAEMKVGKFPLAIFSFRAVRKMLLSDSAS